MNSKAAAGQDAALLLLNGPACCPPATTVLQAVRLLNHERALPRHPHPSGPHQSEEGRGESVRRCALAGAFSVIPRSVAGREVHRQPGPRSEQIFDPVRPNAQVKPNRSEEHTSELQSLMRISYAVFCLKKKIIEISHPS